MFRDLPAGQREKVARDLSRLPYVADVAYDEDSEDYNRDGCTLYELTTEYDYDSDEEIREFNFSHAWAKRLYEGKMR